MASSEASHAASGDQATCAGDVVLWAQELRHSRARLGQFFCGAPVPGETTGRDFSGRALWQLRWKRLITLVKRERKTAD